MDGIRVPHLRALAGAAIVVMALAGCGTSSSPSLSRASPSGNPRTPSAATPRPTASLPARLGERPQIWFGPLDPWSWDRFDPGSGPHQFPELFPPDAPWQEVASGVHVFWLNNTWVESFASDAELRAAVEAIERRGMGIWTEAGPLTETATCNAATLEGFGGAGPARATAQRLRDAGGALYVFGLEHGFDAASIYDLACRMTPAAIAEDTARTVAAVRSVFPDVVVGSVETANLDIDLIGAWLQAYRDATGEELGYFHLDVNYNIPDWAARAVEIAQLVRSRGIEFGITYRGDDTDATDAEWLARARSRFIEYEVEHGGTVDHAVFQSWNRHPTRLLPETDPDSFTHLVGEYLLPRTSLTLEASGGTASGVLAEVGGGPIAGATIALSALPLSGDGVIGTYTISGTVPDGATSADAGLRIGTECECSGPVSVFLDRIGYAEGSGGGANAVPNGDFAAGLAGWGAWGAASGKLTGNGSAAGLAVTAADGQDFGLNSDAFAVTAGAPFSVTFIARVSPASAGHGLFDIVFLNAGGEVGRFTLPMAPASISLGEAATDPSGAFVIDLGSLPSGSYQLTASFAGDEERWPAVASVSR